MSESCPCKKCPLKALIENPEKLKEKLSIAVGKQEFEEAAKLRDEIQSLEKEENEKDA